MIVLQSITVAALHFTPEVTFFTEVYSPSLISKPQAFNQDEASVLHQSLSLSVYISETAVFKIRLIDPSKLKTVCLQILLFHRLQFARFIG